MKEVDYEPPKQHVHEDPVRVGASRGSAIREVPDGP